MVIASKHGLTCLFYFLLGFGVDARVDFGFPSSLTASTNGPGLVILL